MLAGTEFDIAGARSELCSRIECIPVSGEEEARDMVELGRRAGGADPARGPDRKAPVAGLAGALAADRASPGQRGGPGEGAAGGRPDQLAGHRGQSEDLGAGDPDLRQLPRACCSGAASSTCSARPSTSSASRTPSASSRRCGPELPAGSPFADALDRVIQFSRLARQNLNLANPLLGTHRPPDRGREGGRLGLPAQPRLVRDRGRDDGHPDVRHRAAGRRLAGAGARGERLPAADPGAGGANGAPGREGGAWGGAVDRWSRS